MTLLVRTTGDPLTFTNSIRSKIWSIRADQPVDNILALNDVVDRSLASRRYSLFLLEGFSVLALSLSVLGVYGLASYAALQRTREFGLRIALGASRANIRTDVLQEGLRLTAVGGCAGLVFALGSTRFLQQLLFGVSPWDTGSFVVVTFLLAVVSGCACLIPARRAAKVDPMVALRYE